MKQFWGIQIVIGIIVVLFPASLFGYGEQETTYYDYKSIHQIVLDDMTVFSVSISGEATDVCHLEIQCPDNSRFKVHHDVRGGQLRIWTKDTHVLFSNNNGPHSVSLIVPRETAVRGAANTGATRIEGLSSDIEYRSDTGSIDASDIDGLLSLKTDTGAITAVDISGNLDFRTDTGSVRLNNIKGTVRAVSDTGAISMSNVLGNLSVSTDTGSVKADMLMLNADSYFSTDTGSVNLDVANAMQDIRVFAKTDTGSINVYETRTSKRLEWGDGPVLVDVSTDTGNIRIK